MKPIRFVYLLLLLVSAPISSHCAEAPETIIPWLYPRFGPTVVPAGGWDKAVPRSVPGSTQRFTEAEVHSLTTVIDWFPETHDPIPPFMAESGDPKVFACAKCHMPNGNGRLENAPVAGLPAQYILDQVSAIVDGLRRLPQETMPFMRMGESATHLSASQLADAAAYYSKQPFAKRVKLRETERVPQTEASGGILRVKEGPDEALGHRIVEVPEDFERFELRDPGVYSLAYVPKGSIAAGERLAATGGGTPAKVCSSCHGPGLKGGANLPGPPIAGRFPTYLLRQLYGFQAGLRSEPQAELMRSVVEGLSLDELIALAAYAGSLDP